jgi:hypothetical protein
MRRVSWLVFVLIMMAGIGCGDSGPKRVENQDPFKARQDTQKDKGRGNFMMPKDAKTDKGGSQ